MGARAHTQQLGRMACTYARAGMCEHVHMYAYARRHGACVHVHAHAHLHAEPLGELGLVPLRTLPRDSQRRQRLPQLSLRLLPPRPLPRLLSLESAYAALSLSLRPLRLRYHVHLRLCRQRGRLELSVSK